MRDLGIFQKLISHGTPLYAFEEAAKEAIAEEAEELEKLRLEAFYGPMFVHGIGIILGAGAWIFENQLPSHLFEFL